jgi:SpoVK/Ycf46/Vps4 family AAA+-type ATPase
VSPDHPLRDAQLLIRSRHPFLLMETADRLRIRTLLRHLADDMGLPLLHWTRARGLQRLDREGAVYDTRTPEKALRHVAASDVAALYLMEGLEAVLPGSAILQAKFAEALDRLEALKGAIVHVGPSLELPDAIRPRASLVPIPGPSREEIRQLLGRIVRDLNRKQHVEVADLAGLKEWLARRKALVQDPEGAREFGLDFPRGVLLTGVPGCGKSLCARAVATEWELPLLRLDPASLYNRYIGETEKNLTRAMALAEEMAPVVLWIDELEKAFPSGGGSEDGGVSRRILGTFLNWLQERRSPVFLLATANQVGELPPELLRKGRFDEIFFVDLPDAEAREEILRIHVERRGRDPEDLDLASLGALADGFSGAELEQVVVSALYAAFADGAAFDTGLLAREVRSTHPLSRTARERIAELRRWASDRAVRAN